MVDIPIASDAAPQSSVVNADLAQVQSTLVQLVVTLDASVGDAVTPAQVNAILDEIAEVNARVTSIGRQLFRSQTDDIVRLAADVQDVVPDVQRAIAHFDQLQAFVTGVSGFLGVVDKLIDAAKLV